MTTGPTNTRRRNRIRSALAAVAVSVLTVGVAGGLTSAPAAAAAPTLTLTAQSTAGRPTVSFHATGSGLDSSAQVFACFGEAHKRCDAAHPGAVVPVADLIGPGGATFSHTYSAEAHYTVTLSAVSASQPTAKPLVSASTTVVVTIDGTARLSHTTKGLTVTLNASKSTAAPGDTWWACFGDQKGCSAARPQARGTVAAGQALVVSHTYAKAGSYPTSLTINGTAAVTTASLVAAVAATDPTAVLTANNQTGIGNLDVIFDGSASTAGAGDTWAFCYGDNAGCAQTTPDASGLIDATTTTVALPTAAHTYLPGTYTATLWVVNGATTSTATVSITVRPSVAAPDGTCSLNNTVRTCTLFAKGNGSATVAGKSLPFWGFTLDDAAKPVIGGPTLIATAGEKLVFTVHNELAAAAGNVSITVPSLDGAPDLTGVAPASTGGAGTFTLSRPGTYLYEAGLTSGGERQVAMGLSGVLIVRPSLSTPVDSLNCAYDATGTSTDCIANHDVLNYFDREKLVVVNEFDPEYNADPFGSDTGNYHPSVFFVDGVAYDPAKPALDPSDPSFDPALDNVRLDAAPGQSVLIRYADLGLREHSLNLVNLLQTETARDSHLLPAVQTQNTEFLNAGQTGDAFVTIPPDAVTGDRYPLLDAGFHLNNIDAGGLGGMYTYLDVVNGATAADIGPVGTDVSADPVFSATAPNIDNGQVPELDVTGSFTAQPTAAGTPTVSSVRWALDGVPGTGGLWQTTSAAPSPAGAPTASFSFAISPTDLQAQLATEPDRIFGEHTLWLQAIDSNGKAGPAIGASFSLAMRDAVISGLSIDPEVTNGTTGSNQFPVASTKVSAASNNAVVSPTAQTLNVESTAGFPSTCDTGGCQVTVGMTVTGPSAGTVVYQTFTYTGTTPTSFTGATPASPLPAGTFVFTSGNTVGLDVIPAGFVALNGTATASLPGWLVYGAQACVIPATSAVPTAADGVETQCNAATGNSLVTLTPNDTAPLVGINGFLPVPTLPSGATEGGYWIVVRAQEGPDGASCITTPTDCRWSPWLYYNTDTPPSAESSTYRTLTVVTAGPAMSGVSVTPSPNNGFLTAAGNLGLVDSFDVQATATSPYANIALAEAFLAPASRPSGTPIADPVLCTAPPNVPTGCVQFGKGAEMTTSDGLWNNGKTKVVSAFLPLSELLGMTDGLVRIWVHAQDSAGNWGPFSSVDLVLDKTVPIVNSLTNTAATAQTQTTASAALPMTNGTLTVTSTTGFPASGSVELRRSATSWQVLTYTGTTATSFTGVSGGTAGTVASGAQVRGFTGVVTVNANDVVTNGVSAGVSAAEWWVGADPGPGNGTAAVTVPATVPVTPNSATAVQFTVTGLPAGTTVNIRVMDAAGNWSAPSTVTL